MTLGIPAISIHLPNSSPLLDIFGKQKETSKSGYIKITKIKSPCSSNHLEGGGCRLKVKENKSSAFLFEIRIFLFHIKGKLDRGR